MNTLVLVGIVASGLFCLPIPSSALESGEHLTKQALEECHRGRLAIDRATRLAHFHQGQIVGERAVAVDEGSADAHFALFCNLGELLRVDGESLTSLFGLRRMMNELNRVLELDPAHIDALSAKGEALLEHVVSKAPKAVNARLSLAKVRCEHGRHQEAVTLASDALTLAQQHNRADFIPEARAVLEQLQANAAKATYKVHF
jgi:hypothetical protein